MWLKRKMENTAYLNSKRENVHILLKEKKSDTILFVMFIKSSFLSDSF